MSVNSFESRGETKAGILGGKFGVTGVPACAPLVNYLENRTSLQFFVEAEKKLLLRK